MARAVDGPCVRYSMPQLFTRRWPFPIQVGDSVLVKITYERVTILALDSSRQEVNVLQANGKTRWYAAADLVPI